MPAPWQQQRDTEEPESISNIPLQGRHTDAIGGKAIADYNLDIAYKPERLDSEIEALNNEVKNSGKL